MVKNGFLSKFMKQVFYSVYWTADCSKIWTRVPLHIWENDIVISNVFAGAVQGWMQFDFTTVWSLKSIF